MIVPLGDRSSGCHFHPSHQQKDGVNFGGNTFACPMPSIRQVVAHMPHRPILFYLGRPQMHTNTHTHVHAYVYIRMRMHIHAYIHTCARAHTNAHTHAHTHTHTRMYVDTYHIPTCTHSTRFSVVYDTANCVCQAGWQCIPATVIARMTSWLIARMTSWVIARMTSWVIECVYVEILCAIIVQLSESEGVRA